jgi:hypothetical protein
MPAGTTRPWSLSVDEERVFVVDLAPRLLVESKTSHDESVLVDKAVGYWLASDEANVYFAVDGSVQRVTKNDGMAEVMGAVSGVVTSLAVDDADVFVASTTSNNATPGIGTITALSKMGGSPITLASTDGVGMISLTSRYVVWTGGRRWKDVGNLPRSEIRWPHDHARPRRLLRKRYTRG